MKESSFQFSDPSVVYLHFVENEEFDVDIQEKIEIKTKLQSERERLDDRRAVVKLRIEIGSEDEKAPFYLKTTVSANFKWNDQIEDSRVDAFLKQNAAALLLSYARPIIALVTNSSHYPAYNLPFVNFADEDSKE